MHLERHSGSKKVAAEGSPMGTLKGMSSGRQSGSKKMRDLVLLGAQVNVKGKSSGLLLARGSVSCSGSSLAPLFVMEKHWGKSSGLLLVRGSRCGSVNCSASSSVLDLGGLFPPLSHRARV